MFEEFMMFVEIPAIMIGFILLVILGIKKDNRDKKLIKKKKD